MSRLLALAVVLILAAGGHSFAQTDPQVRFRAIADSRPSVLLWVDTPEGTRTDSDTRRFEEVFASTTWLWLSNGVLLIRQGENLVASAHYRALNASETFWALHNRREYTLDGSADRDPDNPSIGGATLYVSVPGEEEGVVYTARVEIGLTFTR